MEHYIIIIIIIIIYKKRRCTIMDNEYIIQGTHSDDNDKEIANDRLGRSQFLLVRNWF
jgi:hypothetical protein